jgi:hypothetical protein
MKMIAEYLEHSLQLEQLAAQEADERLKADLLKQAAAYYQLAVKRANSLSAPVPPRPNNSN